MGAAHHHAVNEVRALSPAGQPRGVACGLFFVAAPLTQSGWLFQDDKFLSNSQMGSCKFPFDPDRFVPIQCRAWPFSLNPGASQVLLMRLLRYALRANGLSSRSLAHTSR